MKKLEQEIVLLRQPWHHFARIEPSFIGLGEKFRLEIQTMNSAATSNFLGEWELYKNVPGNSPPPWDWIEDGYFLVGEIEENGTTKTVVEIDDETFRKIDEPGAYYIKTFVYKNLPSYLECRDYNDIEKLRERLEERFGIEVYEATSSHQMTLFYVE